MTALFPADYDTFPEPKTMATIEDAIKAVQAKVGKDTGAASTTIERRLSDVAAALDTKAPATGIAQSAITGLVNDLASKATPAQIDSAVAGLVNGAPADRNTLNELSLAIDTKVAQAQIDAAVAALVDGAPSNRNTLNELSLAIDAVGSIGFQFTGGTADDTAAAQAVLDAANAVGGEVVLSGIITVSAALRYGSNLDIHGKDKLTQIRAKTGVVGGAFTLLQPTGTGVSNTTIRDLIIDQRSDAYPASINAQTTSVDRTTDVTFDNVEFRNVMTMAVWSDSPTATPCTRATIKNCRVVSSVFGGFSLFGSIIDISIINNDLSACGDDAIAVQSSEAGAPDGFLVASNKVRACTTRGAGTATPHAILVMGAANGSIANNVITGGTVASGIRLLAQGANVPSRTSITGNTVDQAGVTGAVTTGVPGHGIHVSGASATAHATDITIAGNTVSRSRQAGIGLTHCSRFAVDAMSSRNGTAGFRVDGCTNGRIVGTALDNGSASLEPYGVLLISNSATDRCSDVKVDVRSGDTRTGGSRTQTHGIFVSGSDGLRLVIGGNLTNNVTAPLGGVAAGTIRERILGGAAPTLSLGVGAGVGASGSIVGDDTSGVITINTGTATSAGSIAAVTFGFAYASAPIVLLTAASIQAVEQLSALYIDRGPASFGINGAGAPPASQTLVLQYLVQSASQ